MHARFLCPILFSLFLSGCDGILSGAAQSSDGSRGDSTVKPPLSDGSHYHDGDDPVDHTDGKPLTKADKKPALKGDGKAPLYPDSKAPLYPDGQPPSNCPWGSVLPANSSVGLYQVNHIAGGTVDEKAVFDRMNQLLGGTPLVWNDCLADLARGHSEDFPKSNYFGHGCAGNASAWMIDQRGAAAGFKLDTLKEVLWEDILMGDFQAYLGGVAANTANKWMSDTGHSAPIKNCKEAGVGIAWYDFMGVKNIYVTANFLCDKSSMSGY
jgi:uncharacterized protein YkwD